MPGEVRNIGASVRTRLLRISKEKGQNFDLVLTHYAIERLLYRLAQSRHADRFVLEGAMLLMVWFDEPFRGTRDLDLLGYGDPAPDAVLDVFREVLGQEQPDRVVFDVGAARPGGRERPEEILSQTGVPPDAWLVCVALRHGRKAACPTPRSC